MPGALIALGIIRSNNGGTTGYLVHFPPLIPSRHKLADHRTAPQAPAFVAGIARRVVEPCSGVSRNRGDAPCTSVFTS